MRYLPKLLIAFFALAAVACTNTPNVDTDYSQQVNFSQLKTYAIAPTKQELGENLLISPFTFAHLEAVIADNLSARYVRQGADSKPDFIVSYHVVIEEKLDSRTYSDFYGYNGYWGGPFYRPRGYFYGVNSGVRVYNQGSLIVDVTDAEGKPLWRGVSQKRLSKGLSNQSQRQVLSEAVAEVLAQFPPTN